MKTLYVKILLLAFLNIYSQGTQNPSGIRNVCSGLTAEDVPHYTYFSDLDNTFTNFIGTWVYTNGNEIVTFKLSKVTQKYFPAERIFEDFMVGNYSYSTDGGTTLVVNTIVPFLNNDPDNNPMYTPCVEDNKMIFVFKDVILNKSYCYATFEFITGSLTQLRVKIENPKEILGRFEGQPEYNYNFTLPTTIIVTKQ